MSRALVSRRAAAVLFVLLVVVVYAHPLLTHTNFGGRDLTVYNLPLEKNIHDAWARGRLPVWSDDISGGRPLLANPNSGALYPVRPLLSALPFPVAMRIFPVLHWMLAGLGMLLLLREWNVSTAAAWIGAVTYVFSGVSVTQAVFPHTQPGVTWLPWILWAFVRRGARSLVSKAAVLSFLFCLVFLAGDVFTAGTAILCCFLWMLLRYRDEGRKPQAAVLGGALLGGTLLALPQLVATALWIPETSRAIQGMKLWEAFFFSVPPARLLELVVPYPFGATWALDPTLVWAPGLFHGKSLGLFPTLYCGAFATASIALSWNQRKSSAPFHFTYLVLLIGLVMSVAPSLLPAFLADLPSPVALRNPEKMAVAIAFSLSLLAALTFDGTRRRRLPRWMLWSGGVFAALASATLLLPNRGAPASSPGIVAIAARAHLPQAVAEGGLYWMATVVAISMLGSASRRAPIAAVILLSCVPILANRRIAQEFREDRIFAPTAFVRYLRQEDPLGQFRTLGESLFLPGSSLAMLHVGQDPGQIEFARRDWLTYTGSLWERGTVFNSHFDAGDLSRLESLRRLSGIIQGIGGSQAALLGSVSLRWGVRYRDQSPMPGYRRVGGDLLQSWDELPSALPDIRLLEHWTEESDPVSAFGALRLVRGPEMVIESGARKRGTSPPGQLKVLEKSPDRLTLETETVAPTWLFVLRGYWPYRTIRIDGTEVSAFPAQLAFCGLPIPAGRHRIQWREEVPAPETFWIGPILFLLLLLGCIARSKWSRGLS